MNKKVQTIDDDIQQKIEELILLFNKQKELIDESYTFEEVASIRENQIKYIKHLKNKTNNR